MSTFNRSEIMKSAWNLVRTAGKSISEALRAAWAKAKAPKEPVYIGMKLQSPANGVMTEVVDVMEKMIVCVSGGRNFNIPRDQFFSLILPKCNIIA